jgi:hypothetical protein
MLSLCGCGYRWRRGFGGCRCGGITIGALNTVAYSSRISFGYVFRGVYYQLFYAVGPVPYAVVGAAYTLTIE